jgi:putative membrane protein
MKRVIQGLVLAGSLVVGGAAFAQSNVQGGTQGTQGGTTQGGSMQGGSMQGGAMQGGTQGQTMAGKSVAKGGMVEHMGFMVPADQKAMLERLHHVNQMEIQFGTLAQQNAMSQDVKSYGEMLVRDHKAADERLMSFAQQKGLKLSTPKPMNDMERKAMAAERAALEKFQVLKGQPFDASFLAHMVSDHDMALGKVMAAQQNVTDTSMTPLLQQVTQSMTQHRQQAYTLLGRIGPGATTAGVGGAGEMGQGMHQGMHQGTGTGSSTGTGSTTGTGIGGTGDTNKGTKGTGDKNTMDPGQQKKY